MSDNHGRFIWYELLTDDLPAAKRFYGEVVGWTAQDMNAGDMPYTVVNADGAGVGGMMPIPDEAKANGAPPSWSGYICVDDADRTAEQIRARGGKVIHGPQDIPNIGRFAVVAAPDGAVFEIMTPAPMDAERPTVPPGAPGRPSWHELYAADVDKDFAFYSELFGWRKDQAIDMGPMGVYQLFANQDGVVGGMMRKPDNVPSPAWLYYFQVGDIDAAAQRVKASGGQVMNGPMEVPGGDWVLQARDPQGAAFALLGTHA